MIKAYTDIEQSNKLAEILPLESADMCLTFVNNIWNPVWGKADDIYQLQKACYEPDYTKDEYVDFDEFEPKVVPCWSLAALLEIIPVTIERADNRCRLRMDKSEEDFDIWYEDIDSGLVQLDLDIITPNMVDTCVEMIEKLHNEKLL